MLGLVVCEHGLLGRGERHRGCRCSVGIPWRLGLGLRVLEAGGVRVIGLLVRAV